MGREGVRFASGAEECAAWLFRPSSSAAPAPCVVMASGLSCVREQRLDAFAERFAAAGFAVLAFDYRHFGESGGAPRSLMSARRQREDWRAALAYARSREDIDSGRIAIWGFSLGGGNAQALAISEPAIAAAIVVAPVVDGVRTLLHIGGPAHIARLTAAGIRDALRGLRGADPHLIPAAGPPGSRAVLARPDTLAEFEAVTPPGSTWRNELCARAVLAPPYHLARRARRIRCPILYCIAEDDEINPPALGRAAAERAPEGELRTYPGGHFAPLLGDGFERAVADQVDFLRRHLLDGPPS
jgi:pimeloyl-ACP methyl ester carboxylesterase